MQCNYIVFTSSFRICQGFILEKSAKSPLFAPLGGRHRPGPLHPRLADGIRLCGGGLRPSHYCIHRRICGREVSDPTGIEPFSPRLRLALPWVKTEGNHTLCKGCIRFVSLCHSTPSASRNFPLCVSLRLCASNPGAPGVAQTVYNSPLRGTPPLIARRSGRTGRRWRAEKVR